MNKNHILLKLVLNKIGLGNLEEIDDFTKRKTLQKKIYILQLTGLDLGYRYNWYLKGPYCPALADATLTLREEVKYDKEFNDYRLNSKTKSSFGKLKEIIALPSTPQTEESEWLELLASLHYLKHIAYWSGKDNPRFEEVFERLSKSKPRFAGKKELAKVAWKRLNAVGLVKNKSLE